MNYVHTLSKNSEYLVNSGTRFGAGTKVLAADAKCVSLSLFERDLSIRDVTFIASNNNRCVLRQVPLELLHPDVDLRPRLQVGDVVDNQRSYNKCDEFMLMRDAVNLPSAP